MDTSRSILVVRYTRDLVRICILLITHIQIRPICSGILANRPGRPMTMERVKLRVVVRWPLGPADQSGPLDDHRKNRNNSRWNRWNPLSKHRNRTPWLSHPAWWVQMMSSSKTPTGALAVVLRYSTHDQTASQRPARYQCRYVNLSNAKCSPLDQHCDQSDQSPLQTGGSSLAERDVPFELLDQWWSDRNQHTAEYQFVYEQELSRVRTR